MDNLSIVIIICILVILCIISVSNPSVKEGYRAFRPLRPARPYKFYKTQWDDLWNIIWFRDFGYTQRPYRYCDTCAHKTRRDCSLCTTCGWCTPYKAGPGKCEPGNEFGPYLRRDCFDWDYGGKSSGLY